MQRTRLGTKEFDNPYLREALRVASEADKRTNDMRQKLMNEEHVKGVTGQVGQETLDTIQEMREYLAKKENKEISVSEVVKRAVVEAVVQYKLRK